MAESSNQPPNWLSGLPVIGKNIYAYLKYDKKGEERLAKIPVGRITCDRRMIHLGYIGPSRVLGDHPVITATIPMELDEVLFIFYKDLNGVDQVLKSPAVISTTTITVPDGKLILAQYLDGEEKKIAQIHYP